jgi:hypothetical protein
VKQNFTIYHQQNTMKMLIKLAQQVLPFKVNNLDRMR